VREILRLPRRLVLVILALIVVLVIGVVGYMTIEGWSFLDSLYMTATTLSTVGYREVHPLSTGGEIFGIFLIIGGVGVMLYALTSLVGYMVEGRPGGHSGEPTDEREIRQVEGTHNHWLFHRSVLVVPENAIRAQRELQGINPQ